MEFIVVGNFDDVDDPVKTEYTIFKQLTNIAEALETPYVYVGMPIAFLINKTGIHRTQELIDTICNNHQNRKLFFVCQHIKVNQLNFHDHLVFTPHATILDSYMPLPHYSCNYDESYAKSWEEREYTFSFMGSFNTHPVRRKIYEHLGKREDCLVVDTGAWHFENPTDAQQHNRREYIQLLGNTKYSLCPRGTGPSSIRIWEAMAMSSIPIIVSDFLQMPLEREISTTTWLRIPELFNIQHLDFIETSVQSYSNKEYVQNFANTELYRSITHNL